MSSTQVGNLRIQLSASTANLANDLRRATSQVATFGSNIASSVRKSAGHFAGIGASMGSNLASGMGAALKAANPLSGLTPSLDGLKTIVLGTTAAVAGMSVKLAADAESTNAAFEVLLGSAEKAQQVLADVRKFAAETPFGSDELFAGARMLSAYGTEAAQLVPTLRSLGDIASAVQAPLNDIAYLYGTLRTQGRAYSVDVRQFSGRGIPIHEELARVLRVEKSEVMALVEEGKVGFPQVVAAFSNMTSSAGKFSAQAENLKQDLARALGSGTGTLALRDLEQGRVGAKQLADALAEIGRGGTAAPSGLDALSAKVGAVGGDLEALVRAGKVTADQIGTAMAGVDFDPLRKQLSAALQVKPGELKQAFDLGRVGPERLADAFAAVGTKGAGSIGGDFIADMAAELKVAREELLTFVAAGRIGPQQVAKAFEKLTIAEGRYYGQTEKQSKTLTGLWSTLTDNVSLTMADFGKSLIEDFNLKALTSEATKFVENMKADLQSIRPTIKSIASFTEGVFNVAYQVMKQIVATGHAGFKIIQATFGGAFDGLTGSMKGWSMTYDDAMGNAFDFFKEVARAAGWLLDQLKKLAGFISRDLAASFADGIGSIVRLADQMPGWVKPKEWGGGEKFDEVTRAKENHDAGLVNARAMYANGGRDNPRVVALVEEGLAKSKARLEAAIMDMPGIGQEYRNALDSLNKAKGTPGAERSVERLTDSLAALQERAVRLAKSPLAMIADNFKADAEKLRKAGDELQKSNKQAEFAADVTRIADSFKAARKEAAALKASIDAWNSNPQNIAYMLTELNPAGFSPLSAAVTLKLREGALSGLQSAVSKTTLEVPVELSADIKDAILGARKQFAPLLPQLKKQVSDLQKAMAAKGGLDTRSGEMALGALAQDAIEKYGFGPTKAPEALLQGSVEAESAIINARMQSEFGGRDLASQALAVLKLMLDIEKKQEDRLRELGRAFEKNVSNIKVIDKP